MRALLAIALVGCTSPTSQHVAAATSCGAGTHEQAGMCVPLPTTQYTIRARKTITALPGDPTEPTDASDPVEIVLSGTHPDGKPAMDAVVLLTDRPNAGTFDPPTLALDATHRRAKFTPCHAATPGCTGPLELRMALASAPTTPVATFPVS